MKEERSAGKREMMLWLSKKVAQSNPDGWRDWLDGTNTSSSGVWGTSASLVRKKSEDARFSS